MEFKIAWLYFDLLELYSDGGNIKVLKSILEDNGITPIIQECSIGDEVDLSSFDLLFLGGGNDLNMSLLSENLLRRRDSFIKAMNSKTFILAICGGYQMFGKYYKDHLGNTIDCLNIFDFYTETQDKRLVGNLKIKANEIYNIDNELIGFENHGGHTKGITLENSFGTVLNGYGNNLDDNTEGYINEYFLGTYMHGPLLPKNPEVAKYIIERVMKNKKNIEVDIKLKYLEEAKKAKQEVKFEEK